MNNYLEASSENVIWGGSDPDIANMVPSDIEVRRNHFFKPTSWKGKWLVKNLYESKASKRTLIEGNIFENNWQDGQNGSAIALKSTNQSGGCPLCGTTDLTFRYNLIRNTGAGFNLSASPDPNVAVPMQRVTIHDNVMSNIDAGSFNGVGIGFMINQNPADLTLSHNTIVAPTNNRSRSAANQTPPIRLAFRDNIIGGGLYGVEGPGHYRREPDAGHLHAGRVLLLECVADRSSHELSGDELLSEQPHGCRIRQRACLRFPPHVEQHAAQQGLGRSRRRRGCRCRECRDRRGHRSLTGGPRASSRIRCRQRQRIFVFGRRLFGAARAPALQIDEIVAFTSLAPLSEPSR